MKKSVRRWGARRLPLTGISLAFVCALSGIAGDARAVTGDPNQISGKIEFNNQNPEIISILDTEGLAALYIQANSTNVTPQYNNTAHVAATDPVSSNYEITAQSGVAGSGITYDVSVRGDLDKSREYYHFRTLKSGPLENKPAPAAPLTFSECAGVVDIRWVDANGNPVVIDRADYLANDKAVNQTQAWGFDYNVGQEYLTVRGDADYKVIVTSTSGSDPYKDTIRSQCEFDVSVACDQIVPVQCVVENGQGNGANGKIVGVIDMLGHDENNFSDRTLLIAEDGPLGNYRYSTLNDRFPSSGPFELINMVPSNVGGASQGYRIDAYMLLNKGRKYQYFQTPFKDAANGRVFVDQGQTVDLGETFVLDPGHVHGDIFLAGPVDPTHGSCLQQMRRASDQDSNGDGVPDDWTLGNSSYLQAVGRPTLAPGATFNAVRGDSKALFDGDYNAAPGHNAFEGSYRYPLGGLNKQASAWDTKYFRARFLNQATPSDPLSYHNSWAQIVDQKIAERIIVPGEEYRQDIKRCFGQLNVHFKSTSDRFFNPALNGTGKLKGEDFEGADSEYTVNMAGHGTPLSTATAATDGMLVMCLPAGTYDFTPTVQAIGPSGSVSTTEFPEGEGVVVGCREIKDVTLDFGVSVEVPNCAASTLVDITASAKGTTGKPIDINTATLTVNGGAPDELCSGNCGQDPTFNVKTQLKECQNTIEVKAQDTSGEWASSKIVVDHDTVAPKLTCPDIKVENAAGGTTVEFQALVTDNCSDSLPVNCTHKSGSFFEEGQTTVTCQVGDSCGNSDTCSFVVDVSSCKAPVLTPNDHEIKVCSADPSNVNVALPTVAGGCGQVTLTGEIVSRDASTLNPRISVPTNGNAVLVPGDYEVQWKAVDANGNTTTIVQSVLVVGEESEAVCCKPGKTLITGTNGQDAIYRMDSVSYSIFGLELGDHLVTGGGNDCLVGGQGSDNLNGNNTSQLTGNDTLWGGDSQDSLQCGFGGGHFIAHGGSEGDFIDAQMCHSSELFGGTDADHLAGSLTGPDVIYPGEGRDTVMGHGGDDTVILLAECEATPGKFLIGGEGNDTLITPISESELAARGVIVFGFEKIVVDTSKQYLSECF